MIDEQDLSKLPPSKRKECIEKQKQAAAFPLQPFIMDEIIPALAKDDPLLQGLGEKIKWNSTATNYPKVDVGYTPFDDEKGADAYIEMLVPTVGNRDKKENEFYYTAMELIDFANASYCISDDKVYVKRGLKVEELIGQGFYPTGTVEYSTENTIGHGIAKAKAHIDAIKYTRQYCGSEINSHFEIIASLYNSSTSPYMRDRLTELERTPISKCLDLYKAISARGEAELELAKDLSVFFDVLTAVEHKALATNHKMIHLFEVSEPTLEILRRFKGFTHRNPRFPAYNRVCNGVTQHWSMREVLEGKKMNVVMEQIVINEKAAEKSQLNMRNKFMNLFKR